MNLFYCQNFSSYLYLLRSLKLLRDHEIYHGSSSFLYEFFQGRYIISRNKNTHLVLFQFASDYYFRMLGGVYKLPSSVRECFVIRKEYI